MSDFYRFIVQYYDHIFPFSPLKMEFLWKNFGPERINLLDLGCGTGAYAIGLAQMGYKVLGLDYEATMIRQAREKVVGISLPVEFIQGDLRHLDAYAGKFDGVYCIGNTLAHVGEAEVPVALRGMYNSLTDKGRLIVQIVNFDRILKRGVTELPLITDKRAALEFRRIYDPVAPNLVRFKSYLTVGDKVFKNEIELYPIKKADLENWLTELGFRNLRFYGDFSLRPYGEDSMATIVVAG